MQFDVGRPADAGTHDRSAYDMQFILNYTVRYNTVPCYLFPPSTATITAPDIELYHKSIHVNR
jgi:hypothetical protein